jgi:hypothetical protein
VKTTAQDASNNVGSRTCNATHLPRAPRTHAHQTHRLAHHTHPTPTKTHTLRPHALPHTHTCTRLGIHAPKKQVITHEQHDDESRTSEPNIAISPHPPLTFASEWILAGTAAKVKPANVRTRDSTVYFWPTAHAPAKSA